MVLKIQTDGVKKEITGPNRIPVTFINGEKKLLPRGVTFINGQKKVLWDKTSLQIDYITGLWTLQSNKIPFRPVFANREKLIVANVYNKWCRFDITNISNPKLDNEVLMGNVTGFSTPDTTQGDLVYFAYCDTVGTNTTAIFGQAVHVNPNTAEISGSDRIDIGTYTLPTALAAPNGGIISPGKFLHIAYANNGLLVEVYVNSSLAYSYNYANSGSYKAPTWVAFAKIKDGVLLGNRTALDNALSEFTTTKYRDVDDAGPSDILVSENGNILVSKIIASSMRAVALLDAEYNELYRFEATGPYRNLYIIGQIRNYYYVVEATTNSSDSNQDTAVQLHILRADTLELFETHVLDFQAKPGKSTTTPAQVQYLQPIFTMPSVSQSGYLCFVVNNYYSQVGAIPNNTNWVVRIRGY